MTSSTIKQSAITWERLFQWLGILLGTFISPGWFLAKLVLAAYVPGSLFVRQGVSTSAILDLTLQLTALSPSVLLLQLLPLLLLCLVPSIAFYWLLGRAGSMLGASLRRSKA